MNSLVFVLIQRYFTLSNRSCFQNGQTSPIMQSRMEQQQEDLGCISWITEDCKIHV